MKRLPVTVVVLVLASTSNAAYFSLADLDPTNPAPLEGYTAANGTELMPSDIASLGIFLELSQADINVMGSAGVAGIWLDNVEQIPGNAQPNYVIVDFVYHGRDINGPGNPGWNRVDRDAIPNWDGDDGLTAPIVPDQYSGSYGFDPNYPGPGALFTTPDQVVLIDELVIHGVSPGLDWLYFENPYTYDISPRVPRLYATEIGPQYVYASQMDFGGSIVMRNAWREDVIGLDEPFLVETVPEPGSLAMLALAGCLLLRRR